MIEVIDSYIDLRDGQKYCMRFSGVRSEIRTIPGDKPGTTKDVQAFVFDVTHENGTPVKKTVSILSKKLKDRMKPYIDSGEYLARTFCMQRQGTGFAARYELEVR